MLISSLGYIGRIQSIARDPHRRPTSPGLVLTRTSSLSMDTPSLALRLVSPSRNFGQDIIDLRNHSLVVLDLAIRPHVDAIRLPFTPSVQKRELAAEYPFLHINWRTNTSLEKVCSECEQKSNKSGHEPSVLDFHAESTIVPISNGFARISFTISCPCFHTSGHTNERGV